MTNRLIALDLPGGPAFVDALRRVWDGGDAILPLDQRLPEAAKLQLLRRLRPHQRVTPTGTLDWPAWGDDTSTASAAPVDIEPGDAAVIATSGSTGVPKGVVLTHDAIAASAAASAAYLGTTDADHWLACLPLSHVGGLSVVFRALLDGTGLTVLPRFDVEPVTAAARNGANLVSLVPTALERIDVGLFDTILLGGARPPAERPAHAVITYGMTETGSGVVYDRFPLTGVELRIGPGGPVTVGTDTAGRARDRRGGRGGRPASAATDGTSGDAPRDEGGRGGWIVEAPRADAHAEQHGVAEIFVRAPMLLRCYRGVSGADTGGDAATEEPFEVDPRDADGWFATGDLGEIDRDGRLHVHGRRAELIITGGENVWPTPVEDAIRSLDGIADVIVSGTDDPEWGQVVTAHVVLAERPAGSGAGHGAVDLDTIRASVRETLPAFAAPRRLVVHDQLPRTALGKPQRHLLTE